ncbi:DUF2059 domain-containing protein [Methylobacterium sp. BTF04]|uniref:DUF2059 domain-containing protein n=1 Tax=Methylobacterium sp. BTF04 TaxID=2708300 RepID=UPI0013D2A993|nr:DUF2059 domain-containing protein [Methylobacterium sp. BTF04]NEU14099.1 DUF2059 domain-containing protein [Methylobacterium sp. BTF04]
MTPIIVALALSIPLSSGAMAQPAAPDAKTDVSATTDPATLKVAREVVAQMQGDRATTLNSMAAPMAAMMQQMGIKEPERAQVIVREAVLPMLSDHYDALLDIQARSFASVLSKDDLQAIGTFYASAAGRRLATAQPRLAQAQMTGMSQWMQGLMPEMQTRVMQAIKAHGWAPGDKPK